MPTDFNDQVLYNFNHVVGVFSWWNFITDHKTLEFLNSHGVEKHSNELEEKSNSRLDSITSRWSNVTETASRKSGSHEVDRDDVLVLPDVFFDALIIHPSSVESLVPAHNNLDTG